MRIAPLMSICRFVLLCSCVSAASLTLASTAFAAGATVDITRYSTTVSGNVGSSTTGVSVVVSIQRDGTTVDTAPTVTTDTSGNWSATFPAHAPSDALDVVDVTYSGAGAPANSSYGDGVAGDGTVPGFGYFDGNASISANGSSGEVLCNNGQAVTCASVSAAVDYASGGTSIV